jgi:hypothetical protein
MIVLLDKILKASGLDAPMARALLAPGQDELVVHIRQILDPTPQAADAALTLRGIDTEVDGLNDAPAERGSGEIPHLIERGGEGVRQTAPGESPRLDDVPTLPPTNDAPPARPARLADAATPRDALGRMLTASDVPPPAVVLDGAVIERLGIPKLRERDAVLGDVRAVCHALRCTLQAEPDGRYQLVGHFGCKTFATLGEVAFALNRRSFVPDVIASPLADPQPLAQPPAVSSTNLPATFTVETVLDHVPDPNKGTPMDSGGFMRKTTLVRDGKGQLVAASGDAQDAANQALAYCQSTDIPYSAEGWRHDDPAPVVVDPQIAANAVANARRYLLTKLTPEALWANIRELAAAAGLDAQANPHASGQVLLIAADGNTFTYPTLVDAITQHEWVPPETYPS